MKSTSSILIAITILLSAINSFAQIKNERSVTIKISGNCDMCKATIEKAGNVKNAAVIDWNKDTKIAMLNYNSKKTKPEEILKRIALAGYDSEQFLAPDEAYAKLPECCQYNRTLKPVSKVDNSNKEMNHEHGNHGHSETPKNNEATTQHTSQLKAVFDNYFLVKDALVNTDVSTSSAKATQLIKAIKAVEMTKLSMKEHSVWMKVLNDLITNAEEIAAAKDVAKQRASFRLLSNKIYELAKVSKHSSPIYYQHCPMYNDGKGANWLSREESVKNPYYGSQMLTCGSVQETLN